MHYRGNKWLLFMLLYMLSLLQFGLVFMFGALFVDMLETFDTNRATAATVQALLIGVTSCFCVVSGFLINTFGIPLATLVSGIIVSSGFISSFFVSDIRYLFFTIGVLAGTGTSAIYVSSLQVISIIFIGKQKALCLAIFNTDLPVAGLFYPYVLQWLSKSYGLHGTFLLEGGIQCNSFVIVLLTWMHRTSLKTEESFQENDNTPPGNKMITNIIHLMTMDFICLLIATGVSVATLNGYFQLAFDIAYWKGLSEAEAKSTFVIFNSFSCIACIAPGLLQQRLNVDLYLYPFVFSILGISGSALLNLAGNYVTYAIGTALMSGLVGVISSAIIICVQLTKPDLVSIAVGFLEVVAGLLSAGAGPTLGAIRDSSGSYRSVLIGVTLTGVASAIIFITVFTLRKFRRPADVII